MIRVYFETLNIVYSDNKVLKDTYAPLKDMPHFLNCCPNLLRGRDG